jgi:hypothetical protein
MCTLVSYLLPLPFLSQRGFQFSFFLIISRFSIISRIIILNETLSCHVIIYISFNDLIFQICILISLSSCKHVTCVTNTGASFRPSVQVSVFILYECMKSLYLLENYFHEQFFYVTYIIFCCF